RIALAISIFMILAWITEVMEYSAAGMFGLTLFWLFHVAKPAVIFGGFINDASWFYLGAMLVGAMASKSGLPQRIANFVVTRVGVTYSRLLLGLIIIDFLLTFIVPSGAACVVIMASIALGIVKLFDVEKGSNIGKGMFLVITYTTSIFNKMIVAGTASIVARALIQHDGNVDVSWGLWFAAFLPCAIGTILASWWLTLKLFPPEAQTLEGQEALKLHFGTKELWTPSALKAAALSALALALWMTDWLHHIPAPIVALGVGLIALMPFVNVLDESDFRKINLLPFFFVGAALGMGEVLKATGGLDILTNVLMGGLGPLLTGKVTSILLLYWSGFLYHFVTASEVSMLATSMPVLMEFAKTHHMDPRWVGMIWSFASGGKLFAYQSAVLVLGYSYGFFTPKDLLKVGGILTLVEFVLLFASVLLYWPFLGIS
ncbi:SLC13 family permease, partial [Beijerinckia sp. L45]|uniref:SLC13 family permease n=1 Tax=Beijerinckia sp. L45 TaxID=1641855 RepID=UPI001AEDCAAF